MKRLNRDVVWRWTFVALLAVAGGFAGVDRWAVRWDVACIALAAVFGWLPGILTLAVAGVPHAIADHEGWHPFVELLLLTGTSLSTALLLRRPLPPWLMPRRAALRFLPLGAVAAAGAALTMPVVGNRWTLAGVATEFVHFSVAIALAAFVVWAPWPRSTRAHVLWGPALSLATGFAVLLGTIGFWQQNDEDLLQLTADSTASGFLTTLTDELNVLGAKASTSDTVDFEREGFAELMQTVVFGHDPITSVTLVEFNPTNNTIDTTAVSDYGPDFERATMGWVRTQPSATLAEYASLNQNVFLGIASLPVPAGGTQPQFMYLVPLQSTGPNDGNAPEVLIASVSLPSLVARALTPALGSLNDFVVTVFEMGVNTATPLWTASSDTTSQGDYTALDPIDPIIKPGQSAASESTVDVVVLRFVAQRGENFGTPQSTRRLVLSLEALIGLAVFGVLLQAAHDRVRRENERRRREILLGTALEGAPGWTAIIDEYDRVVVGNSDPGGVRVGDHIRNAPIWKFDTLGTARAIGAVHRARSGAAETLTLSPKHDDDPDLPLRIFEVLAHRIDSEDSDVLVFLQCIDVTERRELAMRTAQSERMESIGVLAGSLAHDFNNLLFITQGYLQMMERQPAVANDPQLNRFVTKASDAVQRGATIAKSLLAVARSQPMASVPINMNQFMHDLDPLLSQALSTNTEITLTKEIIGEHLDVVVDPGRLSSAVLNLVFNARDAMESGGTITVRAERTIANDATGEPREVIAVQVCDTGKGMSPEVAARAYEPFFTTGKVGKGTGLGLAAVYSFAQQSGGWTTIESREGVGTTVSIFLNPAITTSSSLPAPASIGDEKLRALIVDDEESLADLVAGWLVDLGFDTRLATSSKDALTIAEEFRPHLLLSDSNLGEETDGAELAAQLTKNLPSLLTVFMTGFSDRLRALETVGAMTLAKPFSRDDLRSALSQVIGALPGSDGGSSPEAPAS